MLAIAYGNTVRLMGFTDHSSTALSGKLLVSLSNTIFSDLHFFFPIAGGSSTSRIDIGMFNIHASVDHLFFIGAQLVALSSTGKIGVWNSMTQQWQSQGLSPITSHATAGSFLLLGSSNGN